MDYKERIRALREDNDYTQSRIAGLLNIGQNTYADYELGKTRIPVDSLIKLAQFYDVNMNYITDISKTVHKFPKENSNWQQSINVKNSHTRTHSSLLPVLSHPII